MNQSTTSPGYHTCLLMQSERVYHPVVQSFLQCETHQRLVEQAVNQPTKASHQALHDAFQAYYGEIRFVSYMSKLITHVARDNRAKRQKHTTTFSYTLDQPIKQHDETRSFLDFIVGEEGVDYESTSLLEEVEHPRLYQSLCRLTKRQRQILELVIFEGYTHREVAEILHISQQSVSRTCQRALEHLRIRMNGGRRDDEC
jgi:RNA polymerase sigma factor (sigma-70 family)